MNDSGINLNFFLIKSKLSVNESARNWIEMPEIVQNQVVAMTDYDTMRISGNFIENEIQ